MDLDRDALNARPGTLEGGEPPDEREHFYTCVICGQSVDVRRLGDLLHHLEAGHEPIPPN